MGRYIAGGLATKILVSGRYKKDILKNMDEILNAMNHVVDLNLYEIEKYDDCFCLYLKEDIVNQHLLELLKETKFYCFNLNHLKVNDNFQNKYILEKNEDNKYFLYKDDEKIAEENLLLESFSRVYLYGNYEDVKNVDIDIYLLPFGLDCNNILIENESYLLFLLNRNNNFKSRLKTAFVYGIFG